MSRMQAVRLPALACAWLVAVGGCNLLNLDDFGVEPCQSDRDCAAANAAEDIDAGAQCLAYRCNEETRLCELAKRDRDDDETYDRALCEGSAPERQLDCDDDDPTRSPRQAETCNGRDDDCDERIDEDVWPEAAVLTRAVGTVDWLAFSATENGSALLSFTAGREQETSGVLVGDQIESAPRIELADCAPDTRCKLGQLAFVAHPPELLSVGTQRVSCRWGQVRVGAGTFGPDVFKLRLGASGAYAHGVDVATDANRCTRTAPACQGASQPALAALPRPKDGDARALALWLAPDGPSCERDPGSATKGPPFALIGLKLRIDRSGAVHGDPGVHSLPLHAHVPVDQPPAVLAFAADAQGPAGYLIAHSAEGGPLLRHVAYDPEPSGKLEAPEVGWVDDPAALQVALPALPAQTLEGLALAWRSRAAGVDVIRFVELHAQRSGSRVSVTTISDVRTFERPAAIVKGPVLAYAPTGFGVNPPTGGWLVVWSEGAEGSEPRLFGVRIAQSDPMLGTPKELAHGELAHIIAYPRRTNVRPNEDAVLRYGFVDGGELRIAEASCTAR